MPARSRCPFQCSMVRKIIACAPVTTPSFKITWWTRAQALCAEWNVQFRGKDTERISSNSVKWITLMMEISIFLILGRFGGKITPRPGGYPGWKVEMPMALTCAKYAFLLKHPALQRTTACILLYNKRCCLRGSEEYTLVKLWICDLTAGSICDNDGPQQSR